MNENLQGAIKRLTAVVLCFMAVQLAMIPVVDRLLLRMGTDLGDALFTVRLVATGVVLLSALIIDGAFITRICKLRRLKKAKQLDCTVEDILIASYRSDGSRSYKVHLLLKDVETDKLYLIFGKNNLSWYNFSVTRDTEGTLCAKVYKQDRSVLQLGDRVKLLVGKIVQRKLQYKDGQIRQGDRYYKIYFQGKRYSVKVLDRVTLLEAAADIG